MTNIDYNDFTSQPRRRKLVIACASGDNTVLTLILHGSGEVEITMEAAGGADTRLVLSLLDNDSSAAIALRDALTSAIAAN